ncbi:MAG: cell division protein ZipA C-terminal FtsZ-binding domain-containing protein [Gallionella sp.]
MSELQAALLAIGFGVVVAVYLFGWWKQRQYSRKFGKAFNHDHEDALYNVAQPASFDLPAEAVINVDALPDDLGVALPAAEPVALAVEQPSVMTIETSPREPCATLDARSDFIVELHPVEPSVASVLGELWQRKFDFGKHLQVCGLNVRTGYWERVTAESSSLYSQFCIALQLLDRGGVINLLKLGNFRDLLQGIAVEIDANTTMPDVQETYRAAQAFDVFCAEVDQMVGVNLLPSGNRLLNGQKIAEAAILQGMRLASDGAIHLLNSQGDSLITLINQDSSPFPQHDLMNFTTSGITLMLDVPRVANPASGFDFLLKVAHAIAAELQLNLVDDDRVQLTEAGLAKIRAQICVVEEKMGEHQLVPGSTQALRLFS